MDLSSLFSLSDHLELLSKEGDPLEVLDAMVDFEYFRGWILEGIVCGDGSRGGRPYSTRFRCSRSRSFRHSAV